MDEHACDQGDQAGEATEQRPRAVVFAPTPMLTVTLERSPAVVTPPAGGGDGEPPDPGVEVHVHAGGQGVWLARMLATLGADVTLCGAFGGELGPVVEGLVSRDGISVRAVQAGGTGALVTDRRGGDRVQVARTAPPPFDRHAVDDIHSLTLAEGMRSDVAVLSGPDVPEALEADTWERLCSDLAAVGVTVVADLSGDALTAALRGGLTVVKVSDEDLQEDGRLDGDDAAAVEAAMRRLAEEGARHVVVSRADKPALVLDRGTGEDGDGGKGRVLEVVVPPLQQVDHKGSGDSMTAGIALGLARGLPLADAVRLGAAAGALNVTRHGLASGRRDAVELLAERVEVRQR